MQQLKVEQKQNEQEIKRECKGRALAISRNVYRLRHTDVYYVESESSNDIYYFVKYKPDVLEFCSCKDYESNRTTRCKHISAIEFAIRMGTLKDTGRLPADAKRDNTSNVVTIPSKTSSYKDDDYSF